MSDYGNPRKNALFWAMHTSLKPAHTVLTGSPRPDPDHADCRGVASVLSRVGDKWSVLVIMMLGDGPKRFSELKRMITADAHPDTAWAGA